MTALPAPADNPTPGAGAGQDEAGSGPADGTRTGTTGAPVTEVADLRVVVDRIEGRSVCGLAPGDFFTVTDSSRLAIAPGRHFCLYALAAVLPLLPAKQRTLDPADWLARDTEVACPDPEERLVMRIETVGTARIPTGDLT